MYKEVLGLIHVLATAILVLLAVFRQAPESGALGIVDGLTQLSADCRLGNLCGPAPSTFFSAAVIADKILALPLPRG